MISFWNKAQEAEALAHEACDESENMQDTVEASWEKTKAASISTGERLAKLILQLTCLIPRNYWQTSRFYLAQKTVDAIDSGFKASEDVAAKVLGKLRTSNKQSYDLTKNE